MATDQGRLEQLYGEMGDEHLLDLADNMDDLTDEGRMVLKAELRKRGILPEPSEPQPIMPEIEPQLETGFGAGVPGILPSGAAMMEQALEPAEPTADPKNGMSRLISFYDGLELSKACGFLEDAEIEPVIEPIAGDALSGVPPRFEVWLETGNLEVAKALLRAKMGLFPLAEVDGDGFDGEPATGLVGVFETREEAYEVKALLVEDGFEASVTEDEDEGMWHVMVPPTDQEKAIAVVAGELGL
jgi:hypothetical protein